MRFFFSSLFGWVLSERYDIVIWKSLVLRYEENVGGREGGKGRSEINSEWGVGQVMGG